MWKIIAVAVSGVFVGFVGMAVAHDMSADRMNADGMSAGGMNAGGMNGVGAMPAQVAATVPDAATNAVTIDNFAFAPASITVPVGTTVTWTNQDDEPHTVVSVADPKLFRSAALDTGDHFSFTFDHPGSYQYFCSIHPHMVGTVVVK